MRIAVLNPKGTKDYSGPSILLSRLRDGLAQLGAQSELVVVEPATLRMDLPRHDVTRRWGQLTWSVRSSAWLLTHGRQCDAVHIHGTYLYALAPAIVAALMRQPYILFPLSAGGDLSVDSRSNRFPVTRAVRRFLVRRALGALALAPQISGELTHWGVPDVNVQAIYNPVSPAFTSITSGPSAPTAHGRTIVFIGKLGRRKSPDLVLSALASLKTDWPEARAVFIGPYENSAYRNFFEARAVELGVADAIAVTGHVDEVEHYITPDVSVFLLPSRQEGLPGALAEAMSCGIPVGVSDAGAMPALIAEADCGQVLDRSESAMAAFVAELWSHEELWQRYSDGGADFAREHLTSVAVARTYFQFFDRVLATSKRPAKTTRMSADVSPPGDRRTGSL